ncbi:MAG: BON domain-containing protein [Pseudomonadales bacterium]|jgi:osmotically-inducible protein OsmY|nr:BON domain-containing protein [Pseudomonadales bacterium]
MLARFGFLLTLLLCLGACADIISATNGGQAIQEDRGRRSIGTVMDDGSIETAIKVNLRAADPALRDAHISITSFNHVVLLVGQVATQDLKNLATRVAREASSSIKTVHNELEVADAIGFFARSNDAWLSSKLKTLMLADPTISSLRTKVVTENGVVYLMGLVTQQEADATADLVSNARGVVKVVRAFEYID